MLAPWKKGYDESTQHIKKQRHHFANKGLFSQSYGFSSSHVWLWESDHKESWTLKNWCLWTVVLEKTFESLDFKDIKPVNPKGNQSWIFNGRTDAEVEALILWPHDGKNWLIGKDPDAEKYWRQKKEMTEDDMIGWYHQLPELTQIHVLWVGDAIQPSHSLSSPSPPTFNFSQHQGLFQWVSSSHQMARVMEIQLQHQSFQLLFETSPFTCYLAIFQSNLY